MNKEDLKKENNEEDSEQGKKLFGEILGYSIWTFINVIWWISSFESENDLNPFLGDTGEFILNALIFIVGLLIINFCFKKKGKRSWRRMCLV